MAHLEITEYTVTLKVPLSDDIKKFTNSYFALKEYVSSKKGCILKGDYNTDEGYFLFTIRFDELDKIIHLLYEVPNIVGQMSLLSPSQACENH